MVRKKREIFQKESEVGCLKKQRNPSHKPLRVKVALRRATPAEQTQIEAALVALVEWWCRREVEIRLRPHSTSAAEGEDASK